MLLLLALALSIPAAAGAGAAGAGAATGAAAAGAVRHASACLCRAYLSPPRSRSCRGALTIDEGGSRRRTRRGGRGDDDDARTQSYHKTRQPKSKRGTRPVGNKGKGSVSLCNGGGRVLGLVCWKGLVNDDEEEPPLPQPITGRGFGAVGRQRQPIP